MEKVNFVLQEDAEEGDGSSSTRETREHDLYKCISRRHTVDFTNLRCLKMHCYEPESAATVLVYLHYHHMTIIWFLPPFIVRRVHEAGC